MQIHGNTKRHPCLTRKVILSGNHEGDVRINNTVKNIINLLNPTSLHVVVNIKSQFDIGSIFMVNLDKLASQFNRIDWLRLF